jgi:hypothetical protein
MTKPSGTLLLARNKSYPLITTPTEPFPHIRVSVHPPDFFRPLERGTCCGANPVRETLIIPKCTVFEDEPSSWLVDSTLAFTNVGVNANLARRVKVAFESKFLFMRNEIWVARVHVF